ncbi:MAG: PD40 domain-containing protein [Chitinophagales bacterium]|nr:PD40 domain-containing protein [Chitinophagales bacterium]
MHRLLICFLFIQGVAHAQLPGFEIFYLYIGGNEDSGYVYSEPVNITNREGYDNQPSFANDGESILYTSIRDGIQADIYEYSCSSGLTKQLTHTSESEYSPEITPDGKYFSVVRVERDSSQRLWKFRKDGSRPKVMLQFIYDIGYYCRISKTKIAIFQLPEPFTLKMASVTNQDAKFIDDNIGRCIKNIPGENAFSYIAKDDSTSWDIKRCDEERRITLITSIEPVAEDFAWYPDGNLFMATGSTIYYYDYREDDKWYRLADMSPFGIGTIYRINFSADGKWMVFVAGEAITN